MLRDRIKRKAHEVVYATGTRDPLKVCEAKHIPVYYDDLGRECQECCVKRETSPA